MTINEVRLLPNTRTLNTASEAYVIAGKELPGFGSITSKKLFVDLGTGEIVYEFYRFNNKEQKIYVIF